MHQDSPVQDYKPYLTDVIKKLFIILGPDITLKKLKTIPELTVTNDGTVTEMTGNTQEVVKKFSDSFLELSVNLVKTIIEPGITQAEHSSISTAASSIPGLASTSPLA